MQTSRKPLVSLVLFSQSVPLTDIFPTTHCASNTRKTWNDGTTGGKFWRPTRILRLHKYLVPVLLFSPRVAPLSEKKLKNGRRLGRLRRDALCHFLKRAPRRSERNPEVLERPTAPRNACDQKDAANEIHKTRQLIGNHKRRRENLWNFAHL